MKIKGKDIGFALTVGASIELAKICPNNDITKIGDLFADDYLSNMENIVKFIAIMSKGFRDAEALEGRKVDLLTEDQVKALRPDELTALMNEAMASFKVDGKGEIDADSKKEAGGEM